MGGCQVDTGGVVIVKVLGEVHWMREITRFMDGLPGLILSFQRQRLSSGKITETGSHTVHDAVEAEDLKVLETLNRLVKQPQYAAQFNFDDAALYACYHERYVSFRWLEAHRHFLRQSKQSQKRIGIAISRGSDELRVVHDFLKDNLDQATATSSGFDPAPALTAAVRQGRTDLVAMLLELGWPNGYHVGSSLRLAAAAGHTEIVHWLVTRGTWRSLLDATTQASYYGHTDIVDYLKQAHRERNAVARL